MFIALLWQIYLHYTLFFKLEILLFLSIMAYLHILDQLLKLKVINSGRLKVIHLVLLGQSPMADAYVKKLIIIHNFQEQNSVVLITLLLHLLNLILLQILPQLLQLKTGLSMVIEETMLRFFKQNLTKLDISLKSMASVVMQLQLQLKSSRRNIILRLTDRQVRTQLQNLIL